MIEYVLYTLSENRNGALLRVNGRGHADCHPWPELGDAPLEEQLDLLKRGETTPLTAQSLYFASLDAQARDLNVSLFHNLTIPPSHVLLQIGDDVEANAYIKLKVGLRPTEEIAYLNSLQGESQIRLDFNERLTEEQFYDFYRQIAPIHAQIDFIEDPFPYDPIAWAKWRGLPLACDRQLERAQPDTYGFAIVKPARYPWQQQWPKAPAIVTSYLDHPLGQLCAAYVAAQHVQHSLCGLNSHTVYPLNSYSEQLTIENNCLVPPKGTGFGFDALLKNEQWRTL